MKKVILIILVGTFGLSACDNDLEITAPWKDIPIVYGILSLNDTAHYIRVEKAFLDPQTSALVIAENPDSLYYDELTVELVKTDTKEAVQLRRVDGNKEGYVRQDGIFAEAPNILYKVKAGELPLAGGEQVRLNVIRGEGLPVVTATTNVLPAMEFIQNRPPQLINTWTQFTVVRIGYRPHSEETVIFDLDVIFRYQERNEETGEITEKSVTWKAFKNRERENNSPTILTSLSGDGFYQYLGSSIDNSIAATRKQAGIDFKITGGGPEILDFIKITQANTGITGSQELPIFSNVSEGRGVFTSKSEATAQGVRLASDALDSLVNGRFTKDLNFIK